MKEIGDTLMRFSDAVAAEKAEHREMVMMLLKCLSGRAVTIRGQLPQVVTREQIIQRLWHDDVYVDTRQGINTAIRKIRVVLHDDPEHPRFLQTVTGKGYRLMAPISTPNETSVAESALQLPVLGPKR